MFGKKEYSSDPVIQHYEKILVSMEEQLAAQDKALAEGNKILFETRSTIERLQGEAADKWLADLKVQALENHILELEKRLQSRKTYEKLIDRSPGGGSVTYPAASCSVPENNE